MKARRPIREIPHTLPEHLRPVSPAPARAWLWQVPLCVTLTLGALYAAAALVVGPCDGPGATCPKPASPMVTAAPPLQNPPSEAAPPARPILRVAFAPLPLSMADATTHRTYSLPPGQTVQDVATLPNAIPLDEMNLIAVVEADGVRHALVRLPGGRILRVQEGDTLQDATVATIGARKLYMLRPDNTSSALVLGG